MVGMRYLIEAAIVACCFIPNVVSSYLPGNALEGRAAKLAPKIVIISMFSSEGSAWYGIDEFDVLAQNITIPGLSPLYPDLHCTSNGEICQLTTGEAGTNCNSFENTLPLTG